MKRSPANDKALLAQMVRVVFPHDRIGAAPYERTAEAILDAAAKWPGQAACLAAGLDDLSAAGFSGLGEAQATAVLEGIEGTPFFRLVLHTAVVAFYNDAEVWSVLGYEGASYDKGGYVNRGFNDLDWLPEPRIAAS
jgi:hypothetical protein